MSVALDAPPAIGEIVRVRSRRYLVEAVTPAPNPGDDTLVRLSCLEDDADPTRTITRRSANVELPRR